MRFGDSDLLEKDKIEEIKRQEVEIKKVFDSKIIPKLNHFLFEVDLKNKTIELAKFKPPNKTIHWFEALEIYYKRKFKKLDIFNAYTITKSEVIKKENCIYISAMNKENCIKVLKRDFKLTF